MLSFNDWKAQKIVDTTPQQREVEVDLDTDKFYGNLDVAIKYLQEIRARYPDATIDEKWTGYEDMYMRFVYYRKETEEELAVRLLSEYNTYKFYKEQLARDKIQDEKRKQYLKLKEELGYR